MLNRIITEARGSHAPPPSPAQVDLAAALVHGTLIDVGGRHLRRRLNSQDHAVALSHRHAVILAVADGVSRVNSRPSRAEAGAILVAELAARTAAEATLSGLGPSDVRLEVAAALVRHLGPLWAALGEAAGPTLHCTLLLAAITHEWTSVWCIGDGAWGGSGSLSHGFRSPYSLSPVSCYGGRWFTHGWLSTPANPVTVARLCRTRDVTSVVEGMRPLIEAEGPATSLYVASDGLQDEPAASDLLLEPLRDPTALRSALSRGDDSDDFAIAWAAEATQGALGLAAAGAEAS